MDISPVFGRFSLRYAIFGLWRPFRFPFDDHLWTVFSSFAWFLRWCFVQVNASIPTLRNAHFFGYCRSISSVDQCGTWSTWESLGSSLSCAITGSNWKGLATLDNPPPPDPGDKFKL